MNPGPKCWLQADRVRYFSLARHAVAEALRVLGARRGDRILLPEFVCRELLSSVAEVGATPCWYAVTPGLSPATDPQSWPAAKAVIAVNYFGFPQDLAPFTAYAARSGAAVIEDNAHGFLSSDSDGRWLGCRAEIGVFSLRKTLHELNGAALVATRPDLAARLAPQLPGQPLAGLPVHHAKHRLRRLPLVGPRIAGFATGVARQFRYLRTGYALPPAAPAAETGMPCGPAPYAQLQADLARVDDAAEIARRRNLYKEFQALAERFGIAPAFAGLPAGTAPYGFAFRASPDRRLKLVREAERRGLDAFQWPDLPGAIKPSAPDHYLNLWLINFLW